MREMTFNEAIEALRHAVYGEEVRESIARALELSMNTQQSVAGKEDASNKKTTLTGNESSNDFYPTTKAVADALSTKAPASTAYTFDSTTTNVVYNVANPKTIYTNAYVNGKNAFVLTTADNYYQIALCYDGSEYTRQLTGSGSTTYNPWLEVQNKVIAEEVGDLKSALGDLDSLNTDDKSSLVSAVNEVNGHFLDGIAAAVDDWLDAHPEATTTVQDGSLTLEKFVLGGIGYVTPQMFGAVADGTTNDYTAISDMLTYAAANGLLAYFPKGSYAVATAINPPDNSVILMSNGASFNGTSRAPSHIFSITNDHIKIYFNSALLDGTTCLSHSIDVGGGATDVLIDSPNINGAYQDHDGIYIGGNSSHITVCGGTIKNARRCGIAITDAKHIVIDGVFIDTVQGGSVEAGIDVEANNYNANYDVVIKNCTILNARRIGLCHSFGVRARYLNNYIGNTATGILIGIGGAQWHDGVAREGYDKMFITAYDADGTITLNKAAGAVLKKYYKARLKNGTGTLPAELANNEYYNIASVDGNKIKLSYGGSEIASLTNIPAEIEGAFFYIQNDETGSDIVVDGNTVENTTSYALDLRFVMFTAVKNCVFKNTNYEMGTDVLLDAHFASISGCSFINSKSIRVITLGGIGNSISDCYVNGCNSTIYIPETADQVTVTNCKFIDALSGASTGVNAMSIRGANASLTNVYIQSNATLRYAINSTTPAFLIGCRMDVTTTGEKYSGIPAANRINCV